MQSPPYNGVDDCIDSGSVSSDVCDASKACVENQVDIIDVDNVPFQYSCNNRANADEFAEE